MDDKRAEEIRASALRLYTSLNPNERLQFLAALYSHITVRARGEYEELQTRDPKAFSLFCAVNELHHGLSNHLQQIAAGNAGYDAESLFAILIAKVSGHDPTLILQPLAMGLDRDNVCRFSIVNDSYRTSRITGPTHNFLGLRFAQQPTETSLVEICDRSPRNLVPASIRDAVLAAASQFEQETGRRFHIETIEYASDDMPPESVYGMMTDWILRSIHEGRVFRLVIERYAIVADAYRLTTIMQLVCHVADASGYRRVPSHKPIESTLGIALSESPLGPPDVVMLHGQASPDELEAIRREALVAASEFRETHKRPYFVERVDFGLSTVDRYTTGSVHQFVQKILARLHANAEFESA